MARPWTNKEEQRLKDLYGVIPVKDLPEHFPGRSYHSIQSRASNLGIGNKRFAGFKFEKAHARAVKILSANGYNAAEIHRLLTTKIDISGDIIRRVVRGELHRDA